MHNDLVFVRNNMRYLRIKTGLTQKEVAETLGITRATFCAWERNPRSIRLGLFYKLAALYRCEIIDFFCPNSVTDSVKKTCG